MQMVVRSRALRAEGRRKLVAVFAAASFCVVAGLGTAGPAAAQQKQLQKVKLAIGSTVLNITHPWLLLPNVLNYWKDQGYDVEVLIGGNSVQAIQAMSAGQLDIVEVNSTPLVQAAVIHHVPIRNIMHNTVIDWSVVVPESSPYKDIKDLKGKIIGTASLGFGSTGLLESYLASVGMDPKSISLVAVGPGPTAYEALRAGRVEGLLFWASGIAAYENAGAKFRYFYDPRWRQYPDYSLATLQSTIEKDPKMVTAVVRGSAMASLFALSNPDCVRKLVWSRYPGSKPTGGDEEALAKGDVHRLEVELKSMQDALTLGGGKLWGKVAPKDFSNLEEFLLATNVIKEKLPDPANYIVGIPDFWEKVNDFDHDAVVAQAKSCQVS
jgi:NitT/TauT family transport system substrate-binding protein